MGRLRGTSGLREIINEKRTTFLAIAALLVAGAAGYFMYMQWPQPIPRGDKAFYTVDDGQTWFTDSIYRTPPFEHDGRMAVRALVYSYRNGHEMFCPVVERYTSETKKTLDEAIAEANRDGKPLTSIRLFKELKLENGMELKPSHSNQEWVPRSDKDESSKILASIKAPDGSAVDSVIP